MTILSCCTPAKFRASLDLQFLTLLFYFKSIFFFIFFQIPVLATLLSSGDSLDSLDNCAALWPMPLASSSSDLLAGTPPTMVKSNYSPTTGLLSSCVWLEEKKNSSTLWTDLTLNLCLWISNGHSAHIIIPLHFFKVLSSNFTPLLLSLKHLHHSLSLYTEESYPHQNHWK